MPQKDASPKDYTFPQKVWVAASIVTLVVIVILMLKAILGVLLLVFAGTLIAVFFRGLSGLIARYTNWNDTLCLVISVLGFLLIIIMMSWLIGSKLQTQITQLSETLPSTVQSAIDQINDHPIGEKIIKHISSAESQEKAKTMASTFFKSTFGILGDIYVVLFLGIFFTVSPQIYKDGIIKLVPIHKRQKALDLWNKLDDGLKKWLKGKIFAMLVVVVLTALGLLAIGMPMWLALAIIAGLLNFIPNFGPLLAMIPAALVAMLQGLGMVGLVVGLYVIIQVVESNFITPQIQMKLISIPPAMIIVAQLIMGVFTGGWGLLLATPLLLIMIIVVQETYIKSLENQN